MAYTYFIVYFKHTPLCLYTNNNDIVVEHSFVTLRCGCDLGFCQCCVCSHCPLPSPPLGPMAACWQMIGLLLTLGTCDASVCLQCVVDWERVCVDCLASAP